jgi:phthalate 4,5-dioxygenase oxygenase subunit
VTFSGIAGIAIQDSSLQESMGTVADRSKENLVSTDNGIIMARHRLRKAAEALQKGIAPPGLAAQTHRVHSASVVLPPDVAFQDAAREALIAQAGVPLTSV